MGSVESDMQLQCIEFQNNSFITLTVRIAASGPLVAKSSLSRSEALASVDGMEVDAVSSVPFQSNGLGWSRTLIHPERCPLTKPRSCRMISENRRAV